MSMKERVSLMRARLALLVAVVQVWCVGVVYRAMSTRLVLSKRGSIASQVVGVILIMMILGAIGGTAFVMASNVTLYAGCSPAVTILMTVGVPSVAAVAIMLYIIPRKT